MKEESTLTGLRTGELRGKGKRGGRGKKKRKRMQKEKINHSRDGKPVPSSLREKKGGGGGKKKGGT